MEYIFIYISFLLSFLAPSKMMIASVSLFGTTVHDGWKTEGGPTSNKHCQNGKSCRKRWQRGIQVIQQFLKFNPSVANHFRDQAKNDSSPDIEDLENEEERKTIFEMKRKSLSRVLLKSEIIKECSERNIVESFGPKIVGGEQKSLNQTMDDFMEKIGELRKSEIYPPTS